MTIAAGVPLKASMLPYAVEIVASGTQSAPSTTATAVAGATASITVMGANAYCVVIACFDWTATVTTSGNIIVGTIFVNGVNAAAGQALGTDRDNRPMATSISRIALTGAGTYAIALAVTKAQGGGTFAVQNTNTRATILVFDQD